MLKQSSLLRKHRQTPPGAAAPGPHCKIPLPAFGQGDFEIGESEGIAGML